MISPHRFALLVAGIAYGALLACEITLCHHSAPGGVPVWTNVSLLMAAHVPYAVLAFLVFSKKIPVGPIKILIAGALLRAVLIPALPFFSDDVYRYAWDGKVSTAGYNPYVYAPDAPQLAHLRDAGWQKINNRDLPTIYPPAAQGSFAAHSLLSDSIYPHKLGAGIADLGVALLIFLLAGGPVPWRQNSARQETSPSSSSPCGAMVLYALNPLVCVESAMSGHLESLAVALALLGLLIVTQRPPGLPSTLGASGALAAAIGIKILPIVFVPAVATKRKWTWLFVPGILVAIYLPFAAAGMRTVQSLDTFARRWETPNGVFSLVKAATQTGLEALRADGDETGMMHLPFLDGPAGALEGTFFSLHKDGPMDPLRPGAFPREDISLAVAKIVCGAILFVLIIVTSRKRLPPTLFGLWVVSGFVLLTPVFHPWYILWVLPFAAVHNRWYWFAFGSVLPLSYLPLQSWWNESTWTSPIWIPIVQWATLGICWFAMRKKVRN